MGAQEALALCPTDNIYDQFAEGLVTEGQIADQIEVCVNAVRSQPDVFVEFYNCDYKAIQEEITSPPRSALKSKIQGSESPTYPLDVAATAFSLDMATTDTFRENHIGSDMSTFEQRIEKAGWFQEGKGYPVGENIAGGHSSVRELVLAWVCSDTHRDNLMSCSFDSVGTGVIYDPSTELVLWFTQDFGCSQLEGRCKCDDIRSSQDSTQVMTNEEGLQAIGLRPRSPQTPSLTPPLPIVENHKQPPPQQTTSPPQQPSAPNELKSNPPPSPTVSSQPPLGTPSSPLQPTKNSLSMTPSPSSSQISTPLTPTPVSQLTRSSISSSTQQSISQSPSHSSSIFEPTSFVSEEELLNFPSTSPSTNKPLPISLTGSSFTPIIQSTNSTLASQQLPTKASLQYENSTRLVDSPKVAIAAEKSEGQSGCLYTLNMEYNGETGIATTNSSNTSLILAFSQQIRGELSLDSFKVQLEGQSKGSISSLKNLGGIYNGTVFLVGVQVPSRYEGRVIVVADDRLNVGNVTYQIRQSPLHVQSVGWSLEI
eukprot:TRINITY_DN4892_c0_g1_i3.p1 TRINITY_DN4892_c0_g1~~TRINITY_DN4892_c0_g1_i3.p1  ORF type:complete len:626 (-),score=46.30 TRINITY_DN4892_c0_g1_i3:200-1816(-)